LHSTGQKQLAQKTTVSTIISWYYYKIYLTSIIKPSFYYLCVAVGKILAVAGFLAGRDSEKKRVYAFFSESSISANFASRACLKKTRLQNFADQHTRVIIDGFY